MKPYAQIIPGPNLDLPFRVLEGAVVVHLVRKRPLVLPLGGAWPGLAHLSDHLVAYLEPISTTMAPDTRTEPDSYEGQTAALTLIVVQALISVGSVEERLRFAEELGLPMRTMNQVTGARIIGTVRETYVRLMNT